MSIKLAILQNGEQVVAEMKELMDEGNPVGYLFTTPQRVTSAKQFLIEENDDGKSVQVTLSPWVLLTSDEEIVVPKNYVVTIMEPLDSLKEMYLDKLNGKNNKSNSSNE